MILGLKNSDERIISKTKKNGQNNVLPILFYEIKIVWMLEDSDHLGSPSPESF